ncbi:hypothetical protein EDC02_0983 [Micromonospora sp. Llam0]|nr:hypothetical protein EDC02_0983 [Micromonospora sp. Llam0]
MICRGAMVIVCGVLMVVDLGYDARQVRSVIDTIR